MVHVFLYILYIIILYGLQMIGLIIIIPYFRILNLIKLPVVVFVITHHEIQQSGPMHVLITYGIYPGMNIDVILVIIQL